MMLPIGFQNSIPFSSPGIAGTAGSLSASPSFNNTAQPQLARSISASPDQNSLISILPMLLQIMTSMLSLFQFMSGSSGGSGSGGTAGTAGLPGGIAGTAGTSGTAGTAGTLGNLGSSIAGTVGTAGTAGLPGAIAGTAGTTGTAGTGGLYGAPSAADTGSTLPGATTPGTTVPVGTLPGSTPIGSLPESVPGSVPSPAPAPVPSPAPGTTTGGTIPTDSTGINPITTALPGGIQSIGQVANQSLNQIRGTDYTKLNETQRQDFNGVSRDSAAIIHLGGRANISGAVSANGVPPSAQIYNNVLNNPSNFHPEEVALVKKFSQDEIKRHGMITGEDLDHAFIDEMGTRDGLTTDQLKQYHTAIDQRVSKMLANPNRQAVIADTKKPLNLVDDINTLQGQSGLNSAEQGIFRLAGHAVLFSGDGRVNGDILSITAGNPNALDNKGAGNNGSVDATTQALISADVADNGKIDGSALKAAEESVLSKLYLGGKGVLDNQTIINNGKQIGLQNGRTPEQITKAIAGGSKQALADFKKMAVNHTPAMLALGGTMAGAVAVCPFLGGMAAGAAGIGAAQKMAQPKAS